MAQPALGSLGPVVRLAQTANVTVRLDNPHFTNGVGWSRIVELHGGRIWLESVLGKGSTFFLSLPIKAEKQAVAASVNSDD